MFTFFLVPLELKLENSFPNRIRLSLSTISVNGANISDNSKNPLYSYTDSLTYSPSRRTFAPGEKEAYTIYAGYRIFLRPSERDSIVSKGKYAQHKHKVKVYDLEDKVKSLIFLNNRVADSLKGYINLDFYNFKTDLRFVENFPIEF